MITYNMSVWTEDWRTNLFEKYFFLSFFTSLVFELVIVLILPALALRDNS